MSKKNKVEEKPVRPSAEITAEYNQLCAVLGNALVQFETVKSQSLTKYIELNEEMQKAMAKEEKAKKELEEKGEKFIQLVADKVAGA